MSAKAEIIELLDKLKTAIENLGVTETCEQEQCEAPAPAVETTTCSETAPPPAA